ncbi:MAG: hypothetical protein ACRBG0_14520 [Lewinella sp.]|jgi:hypothetical protein|uniref:hypothetical protein n=1 Tax=Lewinella sp. TaxID=2004506 RepID=UPI003D6A9821
MKQPPLYQQAFMQSIESTVLEIREEFPKLLDGDVVFAFDQLVTYFQTLAKGKEAKEPLSSSDRRQALLDEILNVIEEREELEADSSVVNNPEIKPNGNPIPSLPAFYATCIKTLSKSVRLWSKEGGKTGYLNYISNFL